jgi:hypothetical protein
LDVADVESDLEKAEAKAEGLERWFRARLLNGLTILLIGLIIIGGLVTTYTTDHLWPGLICLAISVMSALVMTVRTLLILRELRRHPEKAVARLTKWRQLKKAGFTPVE